MLRAHVRDKRCILFLEAISKGVHGSMEPLYFRPLCLAIECAKFGIDVKAKSETVNRVCEIVKTQLAFPGGSVVAPDPRFSAVGADSLDMVLNKVQKVSTMDNDQNMIMAAPNYKRIGLGSK
ncbi:acyl carrier protein 1, chloroplastic-like protein [Tanacetum coccineum]